MVEVDGEIDGEPNEDGITWREVVLELLTSLPDMERSLDGLSSYGKDKNKCHKHA